MVQRRHLLSVLAIAAVPLACIADLPEPKTCPPAEARPMGDCLSAITAGPIGCVPDATHECLQGTRSSCVCGPNECPESSPACFDDECPAAVRAVAPDARCLRPPPESFFAQGCACGCPSCARICDGKGPSLGVNFPMGAGDPPAFVVSLLDQLPTTGRLGVYVRLRGIAAIAVVAARGNDAVMMEGLPASSAAFVERTFDVPKEWTDPSGAPDKIGLLVQAGRTLAEIDCVIPYVRP